MKRIAIFFDGTWNSPDKTDKGVAVATNVVKLALAVDTATAANQSVQLMFYDAGVGSGGSAAEKVLGGVNGYGLSDNVKDGYRFVARNYQLGDALFLFGFSRGAFTARSLGGLIRPCGVLRPENLDRLDDAYKIYESGKPDAHPRASEAVLFRRTYAHADVTRVKFIGVWDTVGALGNPLFARSLISRRYAFHDTDLSSTVDNAFHALAIDEKRKTFNASLWHQQAGPEIAMQTLEQVWFAGVHSNVGGGYAKHGLSDIALGWMRD